MNNSLNTFSFLMVTTLIILSQHVYGSKATPFTFSTHVNSSEPVILDVEEVCGSVGDNLCVAIRTQNFNEIIGGQFTITYDPAVSTFSHLNTTNIYYITNNNISEVTPGVMHLVWITPPNDIAPITLQNDETLFELCFDLLTEDESVVDISDESIPIEMVTPAETAFGIDLLPTETLPGSVSFGSDCMETSSQSASDLSFDILDASGNIGDEVCLPVHASGFENLISAQFSINYNANEIEFIGASQLNLPNLFYTNIANPAPSDITFSWISNNLITGTSMTENESLFDVCFEILTNISNSEVSFSNSPVSYEITNLTATIIDATYESGFINFGTSTTDLSKESYASLKLNNYPNPFQNETVIQFELTDKEQVLLTISTASGQIIKQISGMYAAGKHEIIIDDIDFKGALFYTLTTPSKRETKKMIHIK